MGTLIHLMRHDCNIDGWECWSCPTCHRCVRLRWRPEPERIVMAVGDETVAHTGGWRGVLYDHRWIDRPAPTEGKVSAPLITPAGLPDDSMEPWLRWMRDAGLAE